MYIYIYTTFLFANTVDRYNHKGLKMKKLRIRYSEKKIYNK